MRINKIKVKNFVGCKLLDVELKTPITMFVGANGAGKSSIFEAIRLAITGESVRVPLKKNYAELVSEGEKAGAVEIVDGSGETYFVELPSGKHSGACVAAALPFVLDAQRFARMPANDRRSFLFGMMGVKTDSAAIQARLIDGGANLARVAQIAPFLRSGFPAAAAEAAGKARESKAAWKTLTGGETYGSIKAESWAAPAAAAPAADVMAAARRDFIAIDAHIEIVSQQLGAAKEAARRAAEIGAKRSTLQSKAEFLERRKSKLAADEADLKIVEKKVSALRDAEVSAQSMACPCCMSMLVVAAGILIPAPQQSSVIGSSDGLEKYTKSLEMMQRSVANSRRDVGESESAAQALEALETDEKQTEWDEVEIQKRLDSLKHSRVNQKMALDMLEEAEKKSSESAGKTKKAAELHADVCAWDRIAGQLSPAGIPGALLADAISPINSRLIATADIAEWARVEIGSDMEITAGDRPYSLLSESEKWRCDALIAEAVSSVSGIKMLVLDRFDVLDIKGRGDLMALVSELALAGDIETALLFGTLKSIPTGLSDDVAAIWIENGAVKSS